MRVYISGPYSNGDTIENVRNAIDAWHILLDAGHAPFCPHLTMLLHLVRLRPYEEWLAYDLKWVEVCEALVRLPGSSRGADLEVSHARSLGIPIFYSVEEVIGQRQDH